MTVFTELSLTNFKSWKQVESMRLGKITGLFGANSSGKSSIIQLLLLLKQTAESKDQKVPLQFGDERSYVNLGDFADVVHQGNVDLTFGFRLTVDLGQEVTFEDEDSGELRQGRSFSVAGEVGMAHRVIATQSVEVRFSGHQYRITRLSGDTSDKPPQFESSDSLASTPAQRRPSMPIRRLGKAYAFPSNLAAHYPAAGFVDNLIYSFEEDLKESLYLGPLREPPSRQYGYRNAVPSDVGLRGEKAIEALVASRFDERLQGEYQAAGTTLEAVIAEKLVDLGLLRSFQLQEVAGADNLYQVWVRRSSDSPDVLITDIGFGVSQVLPVLVLCYYAPRGATILLEQPELHLHPSVQSKLADVLIDAAKHRGVQIIVESHSEHLLKRLQRRVAEEWLSPDDVTLYFCEQDGAESELCRLDLDEYGNIRNWPADFFGDEFGEMAAMTQAVMDRKAGEAK